MSQQNTVLIDDIMSALDAESSQNVELIVRNTQNGATRKMALSSLESIIYSYLTSSSVASQLASVLGGSLKESLVRSFDYETCKTWGTGLYFLFGENTTGPRYALVYVAHHSDGYAVIPIGDTADFGTNVQQHNLLYQINSDGVKFKTGSALPCYIKKLM